MPSKIMAIKHQIVFTAAPAYVLKVSVQLQANYWTSAGE